MLLTLFHVFARFCPKEMEGALQNYLRGESRLLLTISIVPRVYNYFLQYFYTRVLGYMINFLQYFYTRGWWSCKTYYIYQKYIVNVDYIKDQKHDKCHNMVALFLQNIPISHANPISDYTFSQLFRMLLTFSQVLFLFLFLSISNIN